MKRSIFAASCLALFSAAVFAHAQVAPSAYSSTFRIDAGAVGSVFQPDYAGEGIAQTSPNRLVGMGSYVDAQFTRWIQLEAEGRWMRFNTYLGITENTYMIGPRVPIGTYHGFSPYGKFLVGMANGTFLSGNTFALAYGGGLDYQLGRRFTIRAFDFEYQQWHVTPMISPYGGSAGISYNIFPWRQ